MSHTSSHPLAGKTVRLVNVTDDPRGIIVDNEEFRVEDWVDKMPPGLPWKVMMHQGNWACVHYSVRQSISILPDDNEVVYGKIGAFGHCVHNSELGEVV